MTAAWCGPFTPDPQVPPDPYTGLGVCANCHLIGRAEDAHHALPDVEEQRESRRRAGDDSDEEPSEVG